MQRQQVESEKQKFVFLKDKNHYSMSAKTNPVKIKHKEMMSGMRKKKKKKTASY